MANAKDARQWARNALHGIGDSLFSVLAHRAQDIALDIAAHRAGSPSLAPAADLSAAAG